MIVGRDPPRDISGSSTVPMAMPPAMECPLKSR
ncbi:hypothetical protein ABIA96_006761 [Bradyrhizobium sp. LB11.1]